MAKKKTRSQILSEAQANVNKTIGLKNIEDSPIVKILTIKQVNYNWFFDPQNGESFNTFTLGKSPFPGQPIVTAIHEDLKPDRHCRVYFEDGSIRSISNLNEVFYESESQ